MTIVVTAPCRIDLAGGTLDMWPLYAWLESPVTVNAAVTIYAQVTVKVIPNGSFILSSKDLQCTRKYKNLGDVARSYAEPLSLLAKAITYFRPSVGLNLVTESQSPAGAGIAGSSAMAIALVTALNQVTHTGYTKEELHKVAQHIETQVIGVPTGSQDYFPALNGGVNGISFDALGPHSKRLNISAASFNQHLVVAYTNTSRNSGVNNWEVFKGFVEGDKKIRNRLQNLSEVAHRMLLAVAQPDWVRVESLIAEEWQLRKALALGVSTPHIDYLINGVKKARWGSGKVCGAGGGGCILFFIKPRFREAVVDFLNKNNVRVLPVGLDLKGVIIKYL